MSVVKCARGVVPVMTATPDQPVSRLVEPTGVLQAENSGGNRPMSCLALRRGLRPSASSQTAYKDAVIAAKCCRGDAAVIIIRILNWPAAV